MGGKQMGTDKDTEKLVRLARRQGWSVERTGGEHLRFVSPNGERFTSSLTSSGGSHRRLQQTLVKAGLEV